MSKTIYAVTKGRRIEFITQEQFDLFRKLNVPQFHFSVSSELVEMWDANDRYFKVRNETLIDFEELLESSDDYFWSDDVAMQLWNKMHDCSEAHVAILLHR